MLLIPDDDPSLYLKLAKFQWSSGEDGEVIARQLAEAFVEVARDGIGPDGDVVSEFVRLAGLGEERARPHDRDLYSDLFERYHGRRPDSAERAAFKVDVLKTAFGSCDAPSGQS